jgi:hypothetical protein
MVLRFVETMDDVLLHALERPLPDVPAEEETPGLGALPTSTDTATAHQ